MVLMWQSNIRLILHPSSKFGANNLIIAEERCLIPFKCSSIFSSFLVLVSWKRLCSKQILMKRGVLAKEFGKLFRKFIVELDPFGKSLKYPR